MDSGDGTLAFSARSTVDGQVHAVDVPRDALIDPSRLAGRCGRVVSEVYNDHRAVTCPVCADERPDDHLWCTRPHRR